MKPKSLHLAIFLLFIFVLQSCSDKILFQSDFDASLVNQQPLLTQKVGTLALDGGNRVTVVSPPVQPSGKWVKLERDNDITQVAQMQCIFSENVTPGKFVVTAYLYIPSGSGLASMQFEKNEALSDFTSFLHLDFMENNKVRIDDKSDTEFGSFPRDQVFIVQVTIDNSESLPKARITLSGANATGDHQYPIISGLYNELRQFGAVRFWQGVPWVGGFDVTNIVVSYKK